MYPIDVSHLELFVSHLGPYEMATLVDIDKQSGQNARVMLCVVFIHVTCLTDDVV